MCGGKTLAGGKKRGAGLSTGSRCGMRFFCDRVPADRGRDYRGIEFGTSR